MAICPGSGLLRDASSFGAVEYGGRIDFTNPEAVKVVPGAFEKSFDLGAEVIKLTLVR